MDGRGHLELIMGPMFGGKTTELLRRVRRLRCAKKKVLLLNWNKDKRYSEDAHATSHDGSTLESRPIDMLSSITYNEINMYDVIAIDEAQFVGDLANCVEDWVNGWHKHVIIAALDTWYTREPIQEIMRLVPQAEEITKMCAVCIRCGSEHACFTARTVPGGAIEVIGGAEKYAAACRKCHPKLNVPKSAV